MASFNRVILIGNLTRDPEVRYTTSQTAVTDIGLAVNRTWTDKQSGQRQEEVSFIDVTLWGRTAELAGEYLSKGRPVLIEGRLQMDQWEDKETGQKRSKLKVVGETMQFLGSRGEGGSGGGGGGGFQSAPQQQPRQQPAPEPAHAPAETGSDPAQAFYNDAPQSPPDAEVPF